MKHLRLLLIPILLLFCCSAYARPNFDLIDGCVRTETLHRSCDRNTLTDRVITINFTTAQATNSDENVWVWIGSTSTGPYHLTYLYSDYVGLSNYISYYSLVIHEYNIVDLCQGLYSSNPDFASLLQELQLSDEFNCDEGQLANINVFYSDNQPTSPPDYDPNIPPLFGLHCCPPIESYPTEVHAACLTTRDEQQYIKVTISNALANAFPGGASTLYLYYNNFTSWNTIGIAPAIIVPPSIPGGDWEYYYLINPSLPVDCYQIFLSSVDHSNLGAIPSELQTACNCCNSGFKYTISTLKPNIATFFAKDPSTYGVGTWYYGDGSQNNWPQSHPYQIGSYRMCYRIEEGYGCATCTNICIFDTIHTDPPPPSSCDPNFTIEIDPDHPFNVNLLPHSLSQSSYHWDFGDGTSSTVAGVSKVYSTSGTYTICLSVGPGGKFCTKCLTICVGDRVDPEMKKVATNQQAELQVYPNPATDKLTIQFGGAIQCKGKITIYSITGTKVASMQVPVEIGANSYDVPVANYADGVYILEIWDGVEMHRQRFYKN